MRPLISGLVVGTLRAINSGRSCWLPGTAPWTTAELDRLGATYTVSESAVPFPHYPAGTITVEMRFLPDPHSSEHHLSSPGPAYWALADI